MRSNAVPLFAALLLPSVLSGAEVYYCASDFVDPVQVISEGGGSTVIRFTAGELTGGQVLLDGFGPGTIFSMQGGGVSGEIGYPELPVVRRMVRVPSEGEVTIEILDHDHAELGTFTIPPMQPLPLREGGDAPLRIAQSFYDGCDAYPAAPVVLESTCILRDIRVAWISFYPVCWNPSDGRAVVNTSVTVRVTGGGGHGENELARPFTGVTRSFVPSYDGVLGFPERDGVDIIDGSYLVISSEEGLGLAQELIDWKFRKGLEVVTATVPEIGDTASEIDAWIENAYNTWTNPPEYILIVGDSYVVPSPVYNNHSADNIYGVIGSGCVPSIHVGRLTGSDSEDLAYESWKIVRHEMDPYEPSMSWFERGISVGHTQFAANSYEYVEFMEYAGMTVTWFCSTGGITPTIDNLTESLNGGCSMFGICGHGDLTHIIPPGFSNDNVAALQNGRRLGWWVLVACDTGRFHNAYCFSEALMSEGDTTDVKGAIGVMSPTTNSPIGAADSLGKWIFEGYFVSGMRHLGAVTDWAKGGVFAYFGSSGVDNDHMHMVYGCPELDIFYVPSPLTPIVCNHPDPVVPGIHTFTVTAAGQPAGDILVAVMIEDTVSGVWMESGYTDASGTITFDIPEFTEGSASCVTATGMNLYPYLSDALTGTAEDPVAQAGAPLFRISPVPSDGPLLIEYDLAEGGLVDIAIYDISGRVVARPASGVFEAGRHSCLWGGASDDGSPLAPGVYFCRLSAGQEVLSRRMVLVR